MSEADSAATASDLMTTLRGHPTRIFRPLLDRAADALEDSQARIQELEAELAGCRACRAKVDCISRGEP